MTEWVYFIHAPRENFAATITDAESAVLAQHFAYLSQLLADGGLILAGPTLGPVNTGSGIFEAADEAAARAVVDADPVTKSGIATVEFRPFRASLLRGRD